jgi:hypothetical protein
MIERGERSGRESVSRGERFCVSWERREVDTSGFEGSRT